MRLRHALTALALTGSMLLAGCGEQGGSDPDPGSAAEPSSSPAESAAAQPATSIPDDFPLSDGMGGPSDEIPTSRTGTGLRDLVVCGESPLRDLDARDRMVADNSGGEAADTRELVVLGDADAAAELAAAITDLAGRCDADVEGDTETFTEVRGSTLAASPAATLVRTYEFGGEPGSGASVVHVVPVGSAVLVSSTYGEWSADELESGVAGTSEALTGVVDAMAAFSDGTTPSPTPSPEETGTAAPEGAVIPEDFPLAAGLMEGNVDYERQDPSRDADGVGEVEMCGRVVWPAGESVDRLVTQVIGPEYADSRELLAYADSDAAEQAMAPVRRAAEECRSIDNQVWTPLPAQDERTGYDTVTMGLTYSDGLGSSVFQLTRVGSAVLMTMTYGEGSIDSLAAQGRGVTRVTSAIAPDMCAFTADGC